MRNIDDELMDYETRLAQAKAYSSMPPKCDQPGQKFARGCRVKVDDEMPRFMSHFKKGFEGIVEYTYAQKYHSDDIKSYSLVVLDDNEKPINSISWYYESQLTLLSGDTKEGKRIIEEYKEGKKCLD